VEPDGTILVTSPTDAGEILNKFGMADIDPETIEWSPAGFADWVQKKLGANFFAPTASPGFTFHGERFREKGGICA
jgi:hypothetical protein